MSPCVIHITMDNVKETQSESNSNNIELYLQIIVFKLALLIATKIIRLLNKLYNYHNTKVIDAHTKSMNKFNSSEISKPKPKPRAIPSAHHDIEAGDLHQ